LLLGATNQHPVLTATCKADVGWTVLIFVPADELSCCCRLSIQTASLHILMP
jgi:hypothetical protein